MNNKYFDTVIIGSGLSALNFIDTYSKKNKKVDVISPNFNTRLDTKTLRKIEFLPSQMKNKNTQAENYFYGNDIKNSKECKIIGSLNFGGLSNYWGLQMDSYVNIGDQKISRKNKKKIAGIFYELIKKLKLLGKFKLKKKKYINDYKIPNHLERLFNKNHEDFIIKKPILAYSKKIKNEDINTLNEYKDKLNAINFFKLTKLKKRIRFHDFYLEKIKKEGKKIKLICKNKKKTKIFFAKKVIFAAGTIATTKLIMDYLKIKKEVKINHHPRLIAVYFGRKKIDYNLDFTPSLLQLLEKKKNNYFTADLRPGNKLITDSMVELSRFLYPIKFLINFVKDRLIFSNILMAPKFSDIFIKKEGTKFSVYTKKNNVIKNLKEANSKIFSFLLKNKIIYPIFKTHFPGIGSDFHYFGTIPINGKTKLSVNEKCQLKGNRNIYIVDSSVFNFSKNKYPLGIVMANARRIGNLLS